MSRSTDLAQNIISGMTERKPASIAFVILGQMWSMKNARIPLKGSHRTIMSKPAFKFASDFFLQVPSRYRNIRLGSRKEPLRSVVTVFYPSYRQDLDCGLLYDLLQDCGVVSNDRWIREKHEYAAVDPKNPRVELTLEFI